MLFVLSGTQSPTEKLATLTDFIANFPQSAEGYANRASHYAYARKQLAIDGKTEQDFLDKANEDIATALSKTDDKAEVLYNKANLIYNLAASDSLLQSADWSIDRALEVLDEAIAINPLPQYSLLKGDIKFYQQHYDEALALYNVVNATDHATHNSYYWAAKAKQQLPNVNVGEVIALLDSAVVRCGTHFQKEAAHYVLERVSLKTDLGLFKEIVADYDLYYSLVSGEVADVFYYYREQAKFRLGDLDGAMQDINEALQLSPNDATYLAEKAAIQVRLKDYSAALQTIDAALVIDPKFAACYRLRAVCYIRLKEPAKICEALTKAVELGDPVAAKLKKQHCK
jgi:tetratricopeptide (TPR) repeat protein